MGIPISPPSVISYLSSRLLPCPSRCVKNVGGKKNPRAKSAPRFPGFLRMEKSGMKLLPSEERIPGGCSDPSPIPGFGRGAGPEPLPKIFSDFGEFFGIFSCRFCSVRAGKSGVFCREVPDFGGFWGSLHDPQCSLEM